MDKTIQASADSLILQETAQGHRILEVPPALQAVLDEARLIDPAIPHVKLLRIAKLTPKKRALVSEAVLDRYHSDLKNKKILSRDAIRELNVERGQWSAEKDKRIRVLQESTKKLLHNLSLDGLDREVAWREEISIASTVYMEELNKSDKHPDEKKFLEGMFWRWCAFDSYQQDSYNDLYAKEQELESYSPDKDLARLYDTAPSELAAEQLSIVDDNKNNIGQYLQLLQEREELVELLGEQAKMYAESVETRRDTAEEMARMYYGLTVLDDNHQAVGPITPTLESFWDLPEEFMTWLVEEAYFFYNLIPQSVRKHLDEWGFTAAGRANGRSQQSEELPAPPTSSNDTEQLEVTEQSSSE